ncbi:hypothetical protein PFTANZ_05748 [Plasmodium falciparum Tanzania (2000708)]|uniref:Uncharacterized protein n=1 Tax=Plasmodium falciparum Tanzania (2000708) TaxID=1036725 RepID=A0A024VZ20_PLAFA|nr:hypothetical protein PFTANZ_05748 [Plasmodium falciparum Tanzania (2000708)]
MSYKINNVIKNIIKIMLRKNKFESQKNKKRNGKIIKYEGMKDTHGNKVIRNVFLCFLFVGFFFGVFLGLFFGVFLGLFFGVLFKMLFGIMIGNFYSIIVLYIEKV